MRTQNKTHPTKVRCTHPYGFWFLGGEKEGRGRCLGFSNFVDKFSIVSFYYLGTKKDTEINRCPF